MRDMVDLCLRVEDRELTATWTDENPETRVAITDALPLSGDATRWGDELYFSVPVDVGPEAARPDVPMGAVAYWPGGNAICLFWGPTPASRGDEPRAAAPVNVIATVDDIAPLTPIEGGAHVAIEHA